MIKRIILRPNFSLDELLAASLLIFEQKDAFYFGRRSREVKDKEGVEIILSYPDDAEMADPSVVCFVVEEAHDPKLSNYASSEMCFSESVLKSSNLEETPALKALVADVKHYVQNGLEADDRPVSLYTVVEYYKFGFQERLLMRAVDFCLATIKGASL